MEKKAAGGGGLEDNWRIGRCLQEKQQLYQTEWNAAAAVELDERHFGEFLRETKETHGLHFTALHVASAQRRAFDPATEEHQGFGELVSSMLLADWSQVLLKTSPWIRCDSEDPVVATNSREALAEELGHARRLGARAVLVPLRGRALTHAPNLAQVLQDHLADAAIDQVPAAQRSGGRVSAGRATAAVPVWLVASVNGPLDDHEPKHAPGIRIDMDTEVPLTPEQMSKRATRRMVRNEEWVKSPTKGSPAKPSKSPAKSPKKSSLSSPAKKTSAETKTVRVTEPKEAVATRHRVENVSRELGSHEAAPEFWSAKEGEASEDTTLKETADAADAACPKEALLKEAAAQLRLWEWMWETLEGGVGLCLRFPADWANWGPEAGKVLDRWLTYSVKAVSVPLDFFQLDEHKEGLVTSAAVAAERWDGGKVLGKFLYRWARPMGAEAWVLVDGDDGLAPPGVDHTGASDFVWAELRPQSQAQPSSLLYAPALTRFVQKTAKPRVWEYQASRFCDEVHPAQLRLPVNRLLFRKERLAYETAMAGVYEDMTAALLAYFAVKKPPASLKVLLLGGSLGGLVKAVVKQLGTYHVAVHLLVVEPDGNAAAHLRRRLHHEGLLDGDVAAEVTVIEADPRSVVFRREHRADFVLLDLFAGFGDNEMALELLSRLPFLAKPAAPVIPHEVATFLLPVQAEGLRRRVKETAALSDKDLEREDDEWRLERWYTCNPSSFQPLGEAQCVRVLALNAAQPPNPRHKARPEFALSAGLLSGFVGFARYKLSPVTSKTFISLLGFAGKVNEVRLPLQPLFFPLRVPVKLDPPTGGWLEWTRVGKVEMAFADKDACYTNNCYKSMAPSEPHKDENATVSVALSFRRWSEKDEAWYQWGLHPQPVANLGGVHRLALRSPHAAEDRLKLFPETLPEDPAAAITEQSSLVLPETSVMLDHTMAPPSPNRGNALISTAYSFEELGAGGGFGKVGGDEQLVAQAEKADEDVGKGGFYFYPATEDDKDPNDTTLYNVPPTTLPSGRTFHEETVPEDPASSSFFLPDNSEELMAVYERYEKARLSLKRKSEDPKYQQWLADLANTDPKYVPEGVPEFDKDGTLWRVAFDEAVQFRAAKIQSLKYEVAFLERELRLRGRWRPVLPALTVKPTVAVSPSSRSQRADSSAKADDSAKNAAALHSDASSPRLRSPDKMLVRSASNPASPAKSPAKPTHRVAPASAPKEPKGDKPPASPTKPKAREGQQGQQGQQSQQGQGKKKNRGDRRRSKNRGAQGLKEGEAAGGSSGPGTPVKFVTEAGEEMGGLVEGVLLSSPEKGGAAVVQIHSSSKPAFAKGLKGPMGTKPKKGQGLLPKPDTAPKDH